VKNFQGKRIAVFDAEIKKRIEDCSNGWNSHDEMGISVLVIFDYATMRYRVFDDKNSQEALHILKSYDLVVEFNTVNFDWKLINATWKSDEIRASKDFDVLREIWLGKGLNPNKFEPSTHGGYKLDDVAFETIGMRKTANGALAPIMFQEGKFAELVDYCIEDVRIEKTLFEFAATYGYVVRNGRAIQLSNPEYGQP
jgi:DEAD/DEAH box helicase domain-containing protein